MNKELIEYIHEYQGRIKEIAEKQGVKLLMTATIIDADMIGMKHSFTISGMDTYDVLQSILALNATAYEEISNQ